MLRSAFSAFLGAFIAAAAIDTVRDRVLDTFLPAPTGVDFLSVLGLSFAIAVLFVLVHLTRGRECSRPVHHEVVTTICTAGRDCKAIGFAG
jgi:hypothetical protein